VKPLALLLLALTSLTAAQPRRKIIINQDVSGPGGSNVQTLMLLIRSPQVEVLGITVVTGDQWLDEEVAHTLCLLEILGRTDIPVFRGAAAPLTRTREEAKFWQQRYGKLFYAGAFDDRWYHESNIIPEMKEGTPSIKASTEDAIHFMLRMVHQYPNEVTIYEGGPMTNTALAVTLDPQFPILAQQLVFMGGSLNPQSDYAEFANNPRHEFNFWMDPEAAFIVLRAPWKKIICTPTDISIKARFTPEMVKQLAAAKTPLTDYIAKFYVPGPGNDYMWDEITALAWIDPSLITQKITRYMTVDIDHGAGYGNTITFGDYDKPKMTLQPVEIQLDLDKSKFFDLFSTLITGASSR
jgi:inosine-uridine nucleoside N-ribohydrolase